MPPPPASCINMPLSYQRIHAPLSRAGDPCGINHVTASTLCVVHMTALRVTKAMMRRRAPHQTRAAACWFSWNDYTLPLVLWWGQADYNASLQRTRGWPRNGNSVTPALSPFVLLSLTCTHKHFCKHAYIQTHIRTKNDSDRSWKNFKIFVRNLCLHFKLYIHSYISGIKYTLCELMNVCSGKTKEKTGKLDLMR